MTTYSFELGCDGIFEDEKEVIRLANKEHNPSLQVRIDICSQLPMPSY